MDDPQSAMRLPLVVAAGSGLASGAWLLAPIVALEAEWASLVLYLGGGLGGLWIVAALGAIIAIVAIAGVTGRSDPVLAASLTLGVGLIMTVAAIAWAVGVDAGLVVELSPESWFEAHRWIAIGLAAVSPTCGLWAAIRGDVL